MLKQADGKDIREVATGPFIGYILGDDPERVTKVAPTPFHRAHVPDTPQSTIQHKRSPRSCFRPASAKCKS